MNERKTLNEISLVKTDNGYRSNPGTPLRDRLMYLFVEEDVDLNQIRTAIIITKPLDSQPIRRNSVSIVLQDLNDQLYIPLDQNEEGYLPETRLRSVTASEIFQFEGKCGYIITGDKELLNLGGYEAIKIVTAEQFLNILRKT